MAIKHIFLSGCVAVAASICAQTAQAASVASVTVQSRYGADRVTPRASSTPHTIEDGVVVFSAPAVVYLDQNFNELEESDENALNAYYRAIPTGWATDSDTGGLNTKGEAELNVSGTVRFTWQWELQYALFIESDVIDPGTQPSVGKAWYPRGTIVDLESPASIVTDNRRSRLNSYTIENEEIDYPHADDGFAQFNDDYDTTGPEFPQTFFEKDHAFTVEFWYRLDRGRPLIDLVYFNNSGGESRILTYRMTSNVGTGNLNISVGYYNYPQRIEAEFQVSADLFDNEWHHWVMTYAPPQGGELAAYSLYRDGVRIGEKRLGPAADPVAFFSGTWIPSVLTLDEGASYNNFRLWSKALSQAEITVAQTTPTFPSSTADLLVEYTMDDVDGLPQDGGTAFEDSTVFSTEFDPGIRGTRHTDVAEDASVAVDQVVMSDWKRVRWFWQSEVLYTFDAVHVDLESPNGVRVLNREPFLRIYDPQDPASISQTVSGAGLDTGIWIPVGSDSAPQRVDVGCFYRTEDRCLTLDRLSTGIEPGDLSPNLSVDRLIDTDVDLGDGARLARVYTVENVSEPTTIDWSFAATTYRAEIPIGESFDPADPNRFLVPALCEGGVLGAGVDGPQGGAEKVHGVSSSSPQIPDSIAPARWDQAAERLFPVHPGSFVIDWPEPDQSTSHRIEIVTALPDEVAVLSSPREDPDGRRQLTESAVNQGAAAVEYVDGDGEPVTSGTGAAQYFVLETKLAGVSPDYPATPEAHYNHLFDPDPESGRQPPTQLDPDPADQWVFVETAFSEEAAGGRAELATAGIPFTASGEGRSVLIFRHRANPDEIANGDASKERLAVRVVQSNPIEPVDERDLSLGGHVLEIEEQMGVVGPDDTMTLGSSPTDTNFSVDFWIHSPDLREVGDEFTLLQLGSTGFTISVDPVANTLTADYFGLAATGELTSGGAGWQHCVVHVAQSRLGFIDLTFIKIYIDGVQMANGTPISLAPGGAAEFTVGSDVSASSLRLGPVDKGLKIDQLKLFAYADGRRLNAAEVSFLRSGRASAPSFRGGLEPLLQFDFETEPTDRFAASSHDDGTGLTGAGNLGDRWQLVNLQEVAQRIRSTLDICGFGSGYILNRLSNYNASLYNRDAGIGGWGAIFPINDGILFEDANRRLEIAYYENPSRLFPRSNAFLHPNVDWPHAAVAYDDIRFPTDGPDRNNAIYIASRVGSEGVDTLGRLQPTLDPASFGAPTLYHQAERDEPGYNPNEEHALIAVSNRRALNVRRVGEASAELSPTVFALQTDINITRSNMGARQPYTSDPWALIQYENVATGEPEMRAYQVFDERTGGIAFPCPADVVVGSTEGLEYGVAARPADRPLILDPSATLDFKYEFRYKTFAGDLLIPPYPLNLLIGNLTMLDERGGNIRIGNRHQRTLWRDVNRRAWAVSGGGDFFYQYFYPKQADFHLRDGVVADVGTPVAWLPEPGQGFLGDGRAATGVDHDRRPLTDDEPRPVKVRYHTEWRDDYPKLKRGETLTYQGGEYFNETPGTAGLPALVAMQAAELVYDSATPSMILRDSPQANTFAYDDGSARIMRPLDRIEVGFTVDQMDGIGLSPGNTEALLVVAERWYFKGLPGSLQQRFYFDSLAEKLVFRGRLNEKESGDAQLTQGPDPINILEPNFLTPDEYMALRKLSSVENPWGGTIDELYLLAQNPHGLTTVTADVGDPVFGAGLKPAGFVGAPERDYFWHEDLGGSFTSLTPDALPLDSFGVGAALVPNPDLLTDDNSDPIYVVIAENNRSELDGAPVSLHIIEIIPDRFRGAIKVIEGADAFSEKVTLQHNGDFGANTGDLYYEWWIRDAAPLDVVSNEIAPGGILPAPAWQEFIPLARAQDMNLDSFTRRLGSHSIVLEGRPDVVLADKLVLMRYRHSTEDDWNLVPFNVPDAAAAWQSGTPAPFQWAGAANSPQLQADGSKRYIPQLVMGWVKRVLDRINPYEARYTDFFGNESPALYSSQIQIAGAPFAGKVALNPDKNVIENVGLIELYETVLQRAKELSIDNSTPQATEAINQALLLAATRLAVLYELLGREAYADAQDPTITVGADDGLGSVAAFTHAFQNLEADVLHEELALLRGTDFRKSYPVFNRMFWNYTKGLGEAAYNVNYNIYDWDGDGFINEDDARSLYPQGHGDAWGHFVSALEMHYELLQHPQFEWAARPELYSLMQNVIEVDYLDEKTFAKLAAAKARAGRDIVRGTYRLHYTNDPDGQWQGYSDAADPARAWGVSEWAHRAGQGAYFDWMVANAILPDSGTEPASENLDRIERLGAEDEIGEIAAALLEVQSSVDEANAGVNPLGFDTDSIAFDLNQEFFENASGGDRRSHFEQIYQRAVVASANALSTLEFAVQSEQKLRSLGDDTDALVVDALTQDLDYRNRLIEIFGRPYDGTIGFGKVYPEGYEGPDTLLFAYLDRTKIDDIVPTIDAGTNSSFAVTYDTIYDRIGIGDDEGIMDLPGLLEIYTDLYNSETGPTEIAEAFKTLSVESDYWLNDDGQETDGQEPFDMAFPVSRTGAYAFQVQASDNWGQRTSYGVVQQVLEEMLAEEIELDTAISNYIGFLQDFENKVTRLESEVALAARREDLGDTIVRFRAITNSILVVAGSAAEIATTLEKTAGDVGNLAFEIVPDNVGLATDAFAPLKASIKGATAAVQRLGDVGKAIADATIAAAELIRDEYIDGRERDITRTEEVSAIEGLVEEIVNLTGADQPLRNDIAVHLQNLELKRQEFFSAQAEGFRLLKEREAFNKILAASVQKNRYQDMMFRLSRNEAMSKYQNSFNQAARYAWLAAKAYDYETSLDPGDPAAATLAFDQIVRERQLGLWVDGEPQAGQGGLAEILAGLKGNFDVLKGQLGIDNPQQETGKISMRRELFRIGDTAASDERWSTALKARIVDDLTAMPEFRRHCRPFSTPDEGPQPGIVIRFSSEINNSVNFFGNPLMPGDHAYSTANFATKIRGVGVWAENYDTAQLATTPRAYLVPIGNDYLRTSSTPQPQTRLWHVTEQRIPTPFVINQSQLTSPGFIPSLDGVEGRFGQLRRHGDFRIYHDSGDDAIDEGEIVMDTRLVSRSVWNSEWLLIIPGAKLGIDPMDSLTQFADNVSDIKLHFLTYSHQGQ